LPKGRDVNVTDKFAFNDTFSSPLARIKIMQISTRVETVKEREETQEMVDEERKHQVEVSWVTGVVAFCPRLPIRLGPTYV
jgi:cullin 3